MFNYLNGVITEIDVNNVTLDCNGLGYKIYVPNPFSYEINNKYKMYDYNKISEDEYSLYGFKNKDEYELFLKLICVKGVGPKIALPMLATGSISGIVDAINRENVLYLTKFPKIGEKLAKQMILDLKGKINVEINESNNNDDLDDLMETLIALGYKTSEIKKVITMIDNSKTLEEQVKDALKLLMK